MCYVTEDVTDPIYLSNQKEKNNYTNKVEPFTWKPQCNKNVPRRLKLDASTMRIHVSYTNNLDQTKILAILKIG